jgi:hypothetical protein
MHHGAGWQDRSECGSNCSCAHGTNFSAAPWLPATTEQMDFVPSAVVPISSQRDLVAARLEFSLRQRPPPFPLS